MLKLHVEQCVLIIRHSCVFNGTIVLLFPYRYQYNIPVWKISSWRDKISIRRIMTPEEIKRLIQNGEKIDVEFKESKNVLSKDVYDSVCSFNNRNGGHIVLGVNDKREITGVNPDKVDKITREFTTAIIVNVNARDRILREVVSNTLAHRDYSSGFPAKMIIDDEKITIENSNVAHGIGALDLQKFEPFPKNPSISKVFREIGIADELGSGMRNTYKYTQLYSGKNPIFEEGDIFRTIIPLKKIATEKVGEKNVPHNVPQNKKELIEFIKAEVRSNNKITRQAIADSAGVSVKTIQRTIKEIENLRYIGTGNNGHWELN